MAQDPKAPRPARPLFGYRDIGEDDVRHSPSALRRAWIVLAILIVFISRGR